MVGKSASVDARIGRIARVQHGVLTTSQLVAVGLTTAAIYKRVGRGRLYRIHRGVYAVGHDGLGDQARWMAAVLASGPILTNAFDAVDGVGEVAKVIGSSEMAAATGKKIVFI